MYTQVYTVGCFDYFHNGHIALLIKMKEMGSTVIVGIHDDASIEKLKNLTPTQHQPLETRMLAVKKYADHVFVVNSTDPTHCLKCIIDTSKQDICYIRANDMQQFPGIEFVSTVMQIHYHPYTKGISSTQIRSRIG